MESDPQSLWNTLSLNNPDALLVDAGQDAAQNDTAAVDLCRMIRNEPRWSTLPIVVLGETASSVARSTGIDAVLPRDIEAAELIDSLHSRMRRVHIYRSFGQVDALTGTASIGHSKRMMMQLLHLSERQKQPFTLLVTQLDQIAAIRQNEGPSAADVVQHRLAQLLIQFFRSEDVVARWSGDEFVVALLGIDRDRAVGRVAQLLKKITQNPFPEPEWATIPVTLSVGLAQYPVDGETLEELHVSARKAFEIAQEHGGNRSLRAGEAPAPAPLLDRVDIVVVDGNAESIGPVIEVLQDDKLTVRWLRSGEEAIRALTGSSRSLGTSLVLLAAELPDIDGFLVFRQLLREVAVRNVIILADAPSQDQVLTALQLGALDYITRPFDIPALVERVHQALQADA
jgi:diguanylate cyclase (GGDEF)-like protein